MKSRTAIGIALIGLALTACSAAGSSRGAPAPVSSSSGMSSRAAADQQDHPSDESVTTTAAQPVVAELDPDLLTNLLDELDRSLSDLDQSLDDNEGDPLNE